MKEVKGTTNKLGQITAFIVVGILILILTGVLVSIYVSKEQPLPGKETITTLPAEGASIERFLKTCIDDATEQGIALLSKQGGYIYTFPNVTFYDQWQVAYHYNNGNNNRRDISPTKQFMEQELSRFVAESLLACIGKSFLPLYEKIDIRQPTVTTVIEENRVLFDITFPITITKDDSTILIDTFQHVVQARLGHILDVKQQVINTIRDDGLGLDSLTLYDVDITLLQTDGETMIYSIKDQRSILNGLNEKSVLVFNMAVRRSATTPPKISFIPDVVVYVGQEYNVIAKAEYPDNNLLHSLQFTITHGPGMIEPDTGRYFFTPTSHGSHTTTICASNGNAQDCETFSITAKQQLIT